jgi:Ca2+-binding RTX toxin-like protein
VSVSLAITTAQATGGSGSDTLVGIENLTGSNFADTLGGNAGANTLIGGLGADTMSGGDGNDSYTVDNIGDSVVETNALAAGGVDRVNSTLAAYTLGANVEEGRITAAGAANLTGNTLANTLFAGAGSNVLDGGAGLDTVSYAFATAAVTASLGLTTPQATGGSGLDSFVSIENLTGSNYADTLAGNAAANLLNGGVGADTMSGGDGSDTYTVDNALDLVVETNAVATTGGTDLVNVSLANYTLGANVENGRITATGAATLTGNTLANTLYAGAGANKLDGGAGVDTVSYQYAGAAVRVSLASQGVAQATGGSGSDTLLGIERLVGSNFADTLGGDAAANVLNGGAGNDVLDAAGGNDVLTGGLGLDTLTGGAGLDNFRFDTALGATNVDTVADFVVADDTIQLENAIFTALTTTGTLGAGSLRAGAGVTSAADADDFVLYDATTGALYYDADGSGLAAGAVQFARIGAGLLVTSADFVVS